MSDRADALEAEDVQWLIHATLCECTNEALKVDVQGFTASNEKF